MDLFAGDEKAPKQPAGAAAERVEVSDGEAFLREMNGVRLLTAARTQEGIHVYANEKEYVLQARLTLLDGGARRRRI